MTPRLPEGFLARPFAHRGLHDKQAETNDRPENSLSAIRAAVEAGYGIEVDLQLSADGHAMVFHDDLLDRMTDTSGPIRERMRAELRRMPLLGTGDTIPTLGEMLELVAGKVPLLIELKDQDGSLGPDIGTLEAAVVADLEGYDGPFALMSFNPYTVIDLRRIAPDIPRGLTTESFPTHDWPAVPEAHRAALRRIEWGEESGASFLSHDVRDLDNPAVAEARAAGLDLLCWTVRSQEQADEALKTVDAITFEAFTPA